MNLLRWLTLILIFLSGCTSIDNRQSDSDRVTINDHVLSGEGYLAVISKANNYCYQFGKKAVLRHKAEGGMSPFGRGEYDTYYFVCIKEQVYQPPVYQAPPTPPSTGISMDSAKQKCADLGFKTGTEEFGKCVLQLTK